MAAQVDGPLIDVVARSVAQGGAVISVSDNGPPEDPGTRASLFEAALDKAHRCAAKLTIMGGDSEWGIRIELTVPKDPPEDALRVG